MVQQKFWLWLLFWLIYIGLPVSSKLQGINIIRLKSEVPWTSHLPVVSFPGRKKKKKQAFERPSTFWTKRFLLSFVLPFPWIMEAPDLLLQCPWVLAMFLSKDLPPWDVWLSCHGLLDYFKCHFPLVLLWFALFIHLRIRVCRNTSIIHSFFYKRKKKRKFSTTIWFLCKRMLWLRSHPNPSTHLTCSLTLSWWIRRRIKSLFEDYRKGIPHVLVCACRGNLF